MHKCNRTRVRWKIFKKVNCEKMLILENSTPCLFLKWDSVECSVKLLSLKSHSLDYWIHNSKVSPVTQKPRKQKIVYSKREIENISWPSTTSYQRNALFEQHRGGNARNSTFCLLTNRLNIWFLLDTHERPRHVWRREKQRKKKH